MTALGDFTGSTYKAAYKAMITGLLERTQSKAKQKKGGIRGSNEIIEL